eukprot:GHVR01009954.1.p1 GENE.GHVR01009954.1~~GHVR01009954.1.p1  ORF type:complete len:201 (-),score=92.37 GHVR01009954.1:703-1305(-)
MDVLKMFVCVWMCLVNWIQCILDTHTHIHTHWTGVIMCVTHTHTHELDNMMCVRESLYRLVCGRSVVEFNLSPETCTFSDGCLHVPSFYKLYTHTLTHKQCVYNIARECEHFVAELAAAQQWPLPRPLSIGSIGMSSVTTIDYMRLLLHYKGASIKMSTWVSPSLLQQILQHTHTFTDTHFPSVSIDTHNHTHTHTHTNT